MVEEHNEIEEFKQIAPQESEESDNDNENQIVTRAPLPKKGEVLGIIDQRFGGNKMMVSCLDGKNRNCRVPGRLKRKLWLRPKDVVLVELWELDENKGDIILKYKPNQIEWLKRNKYLDSEKSEF